jgi:RNA polymerase sigma factor (sigma-70 family)
MHLRRRTPAQVSIDQQFGDDHDLSLANLFPDHRPGPEEMCRKSELHDLLLELIDSLAPSLRRTLHLCAVEGLSIHEASNRLGITEGAIKAQLSRGRAKLSRLLRKALRPPKSRVGVSRHAARSLRHRSSNRPQ